jgi:hypothetical protein
MTSREIKFKKGFEGLQKLSNKTGLKPTTIGQMIIKEKESEFANYVKRAGMVPDSNPVKLAIQTTLIHSNNIAKKMKETGKTFKEAEKLVFAEEDRKEYFTGESENFAPLLLATAFSVAKEGIPKINDARIKQGKKPILSGPFWSSLKGYTSQLNTGVQESIPAPLPIELQEKPSFLKKNKYWVIAVLVVVVGFGIWYFVKKRK